MPGGRIFKMPSIGDAAARTVPDEHRPSRGPRRPSTPRGLPGRTRLAGSSDGGEAFAANDRNGTHDLETPRPAQRGEDRRERILAAKPTPRPAQRGEVAERSEAGEGLPHFGLRDGMRRAKLVSFSGAGAGSSIRLRRLCRGRFCKRRRQGSGAAGNGPQPWCIPLRPSRIGQRRSQRRVRRARLRRG